MKCKLALLSILSLAACSDDGESTEYCLSGETSTVTISIGNIPEEARASGTLVVTGPMEGTPMEHAIPTGVPVTLPNGTYEFTWPILTSSDSIVRTAYRVGSTSEVPTELCSSNYELSVDYEEIESSGKLWMANANGAAPILGFSAASLLGSGTRSATVSANTSASRLGAFDANGNLWLLNGSALERYAAPSLAASGDIAPEASITSPGFVGGAPGPVALAVDADASLWVAIAFSSQIQKFDASQIEASGDVAAAVTISNVAATALAFDSSGNLWVGSGEHVMKYDASRLDASFDGATPDVGITASTPEPVVVSLSNPLGFAFDGAGNLWVNYDGVIAKISVAELATTAAITPSIQISTDVLALPEGIAFDESGALWFAYSQGTFARLSAAQLAASGSVVPEVIIDSADVGSAGALAFYPAPAGLPLPSAVP